MRKACGFTLLELMLVVIIIGVLVAMVAPRLTGRAEEARMNAAKTDIHANIATALDLYEFDVGYFPQDLKELWEKPASPPPSYRGPYLKRPIGNDPWGTPYAYTQQGSGKGYTLVSYGPNRTSGDQDDIKAEIVP